MSQTVIRPLVLGVPLVLFGDTLNEAVDMVGVPRSEKKAVLFWRLLDGDLECLEALHCDDGDGDGVTVLGLANCGALAWHHDQPALQVHIALAQVRNHRRAATADAELHLQRDHQGVLLLCFGLLDQMTEQVPIDSASRHPFRRQNRALPPIFAP